MKNKVESPKGNGSIEASDDVIRLLNSLKDLTFKTHDVQYRYWTIFQTVRNIDELGFETGCKVIS